MATSKAALASGADLPHAETEDLVMADTASDKPAKKMKKKLSRIVSVPSSNPKKDDIGIHFVMFHANLVTLRILRR
jgi:hypothetical protein